MGRVCPGEISPGRTLSASGGAGRCKQRTLRPAHSSRDLAAKRRSPLWLVGHYGTAAGLIRLAGQRAFFLIEQQAFLDGSHHFLNAQKHRTLQGIMPGIVEAVLQAFLWRNLTPSDPIRAAIRTATPCGWV